MTRIKWAIIRIVCVWAIAAIAASTAAAQLTAPAVRFVSVSPAARTFLDSIADLSRSTRTEQAGCMTAYGVSGDTLTIERMQPANPFVSDSVSLIAEAGLCTRGTPTIHTHVAKNGLLSQPSVQDVETTLRLRTFAVVLAVFDTGWKLRLYP